MTPNTTNTAIQAQIENIGIRFDKSFDELKMMLSGFDNRLRILEQGEAGRHPLLKASISTALKKLEEHDSNIKDAQKSADKALMVATRLEAVAQWLLGIISVVVAAVIVAIITGRVEILVH